MSASQGRVVEPQPRHHAWTVVLDQDIRRPREAHEGVASGRLLQVENDAQLAAVDGVERGAVAPGDPAIARVESPPGGSILITRAPMSHSSIAQYGPAITWVTSSTTMPSSNVVWDIDGSVGTLTFNRPQARNALTWDMYDALAEPATRSMPHPSCACSSSAAPARLLPPAPTSRSFATSRSGDDGIAYERRLDAVIDRLERVTRPTIAAVDGPAVGGGCAIALACDLRLCTPRARFGIPVSRTLGNCLSIANTARLVDLIGPARVKDLLFTGRLIDADEAMTLGLATRIASPETLDAEVRLLALELSAARHLDHRRDQGAAAAHSRSPPSAACRRHHRRMLRERRFPRGRRGFLEGRKPRWGNA